MAISEKLELLGKSYYNKGEIPEVLTLESIPTLSELEYVSSEDFDQTMLDSILPKAVKEKVDFGKLLEVDYSWLLRCLRILNYGPWYTTNTIWCEHCGRQYGDFRANLNTIDCIPLPEGFDNQLKVSRDEFLDFNGDIEFKMLTIRETLAAYKDTAFQRPDGTVDRQLARRCYMITGIKGQINMSPIEVRLKLENEMSSADYFILKEKMKDLTNYGLRFGGTTVCPRCGNTNATFFAAIDDRFFRPTLGDLRAWKVDKSQRRDENRAGRKTEDVRKHH